MHVCVCVRVCVCVCLSGEIHRLVDFISSDNSLLEYKIRM